jgi:hypothetical protein
MGWPPLRLALVWVAPARAVTVTEFSAGISPRSAPAGIAAGPDGNLWFTESRVSRIGRITPAGAVTEFELTPGSRPAGIAAGPDGNMWFAGQGGRIGRITTTVANPPPPPPIVDPPARVSIATSSARVSRGWVSVGLSCAQGAGRCRGTLALTKRIRVPVGRSRRTRAKTVTLAAASFSIAAGSAQTVKLKLSTTARRLLAGARRRRLAVSAHATTSANTATRTLSLSQPSRPGREP